MSLLTVASVIAIHGIGAHRDYTWNTGGINWLNEKTMLPSLFPRARIMAYGYASNWLGQGSIATGLVDVAGRLLNLLHALREVRLAISLVSYYGKRTHN